VAQIPPFRPTPAVESPRSLMFPPIVWPKAKENVPPVPFSARLKASVKVKEPSVFERLSAPRQPGTSVTKTTARVPLAAKDTNTSAGPVRKQGGGLENKPIPRLSTTPRSTIKETTKKPTKETRKGKTTVRVAVPVAAKPVTTPPARVSTTPTSSPWAMVAPSSKANVAKETSKGKATVRVAVPVATKPVAIPPARVSTTPKSSPWAMVVPAGTKLPVLSTSIRRPTSIPKPVAKATSGPATSTVLRKSVRFEASSSTAVPRPISSPRTVAAPRPFDKAPVPRPSLFDSKFVRANPFPHVSKRTETSPIAIAETPATLRKFEAEWRERRREGGSGTEMAKAGQGESHATPSTAKTCLKTDLVINRSLSGRSPWAFPPPEEDEDEKEEVLASTPEAEAVPRLRLGVPGASKFAVAAGSVRREARAAVNQTREASRIGGESFRFPPSRHH
jgi:hypothetical protein